MLSSGIFTKCAICDIRIRVNVYDTRFTFVPPLTYQTILQELKSHSILLSQLRKI